MTLKGIQECPKGFAYRDEFVTPAEELDPIELAAGLEMRPVVIHEAQGADRRVEGGYGQAGDAVVITAGLQTNQAGKTNLIKAHVLE